MKLQLKLRLKRTALHRAVRMTLISAASCAAPGMAATFDTGNNDLVVRWDNTLKYNAAVRTKDASPILTEYVVPPAGGALVPSALNGDDGDRNFKQGGMISNRVDLYSEFDLIFQDRFGFRVSGAAWYDAAYNKATANDSARSSNAISVPNSEFPDATRRLHGRKAEMLDAFVFGGGTIGDIPVSVRLGKHTLLWGESLYFGANGIAAGQAPVDAIKAASVPGSTTKEILMPVGQVSGQVQLHPKLTLAGYYQYDWARTRLPGAGSFFSQGDSLDAGGERVRLAPGVPGNGFLRGPDLVARDSGQGGLALKTSYEGVDIGLYATRYHAKTPLVYLRPGVPTGVTTASAGIYQLVFAEGIRAYGLSATTSLPELNFGAEVSVRRGTPLTSNGQVVPASADNHDNPFYAIGNSAHAQMSVLWTMPRNFLTDEPSLNFEIAYNRMTRCTRNCTPSAANGLRPMGALDPNADKDAYAARMTFNAPQRNVLDGLDLTPSVTAGYSTGRSPVVVLGPNGGGDVTFGLAANYLSVWDVSLNYTHFYGAANTPGFASTNPLLNGTNTYAQAAKDRNFIALTARRTF